MTGIRYVRNAMLAVAVCLTAVSVLQAEVKDSSEIGFSSSVSVTIESDPTTVFATLVNPSKWWNSSHTWSGDAKNLSIEAVPGGMFLEKLPNGGFCRHMEVVYADPGSRLRMQGGLGPLQEQAIHGSMTVRLRKDGESTVVDVTYNVVGFVPGGVKKWATPVDGVLTEQFTRLKQSIEGTLGE